MKSTHIRFRPLIRNADNGAIDREVEGIYKESNKKSGIKEISATKKLVLPGVIYTVRKATPLILTYTFINTQQQNLIHSSFWNLKHPTVH